MFSPDSPVIVVGAGPAGSTAARRLATAGLPVRLLDRAAFPRQKPCGGAISVRALQRFSYLEQALGSIATHRVSRLCLQGPNGERCTIASDEPAVVLIRRFEFDRRLVELAVEAGAELVTSVDIVRVEQEEPRVRLAARDGRRFDAPFVIAADGVNSIVARRLGLNPGWPARAVAVDMMEETSREQLRDLDPSALWVAYGYDAGGPNGVERAAPEGYAYVFPKRDHVNVGVGYVLSYFREHVGDAPYALQQSLVERLRADGILAGESVRRNFTPYLIPVGGPLRRIADRRVVLAGDAAGFVNGFTAEGIYYAMLTGELAADAVIAAARQRSVARIASRYTRACRHAIGGEIRDSVLLQRYLFADRRRIASIVGAAPHAAVTRAILDYAIGRRSYASVRRRVVSRFPALGVRLALEWMAGRR